MRAVVLTAIVLGLNSGPALSAQLTPAAATGLIEFADRFDQAQLLKDGPALQRMVAEDLVFIPGSGERLGKKEFIAGWTDPADKFNPVTLVDRVVVPLGEDAGMVSAETVLSGTSGGKAFTSRIRFTDTFKRTGGEWRAVHLQVTRIAEQPKR